MPLPPFRGPLRKLVLALDVGTTFSGVSYALLDPGEVPKIQSVTRFPGQENGDFKIPSVLWYTQDGRVYAVGAEAKDPRLELVTEGKNRIYVEWFKLHLHPGDLQLDGRGMADVYPLPPDKTIVEVLGDFLAYLFECAKQFIIETHPNGTRLWNSLQNRIDFVLAHPNGWEGLQQAKMRQAAIYGGLIPDTVAGHARVHFVTEGEASIHYCIDSGLASNAIRNGTSLMIVDAGGGTVDLSTYRFTSTDPISVEEICASDCILQGSTRVNMRALEFLRAKLHGTTFGNESDLKSMIDSFERHAKPTFKDSGDCSFVKFGSIRDGDSSVGIRNGQLALEGRDMVQFFQPCIDGIKRAIRHQCKNASSSVNIVFLVGGFAASPWLYGRLKETVKKRGIDLSRPNSHTDKAVSEGAVSFFLQRSVTSRIARVTIGSPCQILYDPQNKAHVDRHWQSCIWPSGQVVLPDGFDSILNKNDRIREADEHRRGFFVEGRTSEELDSVTSDITAYRGRSRNPQWTDTEPDAYSTLCTIHADTSKVSRKRKRGPQGAYFIQEYDIVLSCGQTELKAEISWKEKGKEKRGPARIVYEDDGDNDAA